MIVRVYKRDFYVDELVCEGELIFTFPANVVPSKENIVKYYFEGVEPTEDDREYKMFEMLINRKIKHDRLVIRRAGGYNFIVPNYTSYYYKIEFEEGDINEANNEM